MTKLTDEQLNELEEIVIHRITFIDERLIPQDLLINTENLLKTIDPNDTVFSSTYKTFRRKIMDW